MKRSERKELGHGSTHARVIVGQLRPRQRMVTGNRQECPLLGLGWAVFWAGRGWARPGSAQGNGADSYPGGPIHDFSFPGGGAFKLKNLENTSFFGRGASEGPPKEGSGRGPESDLPEDSMIF